MELFFIFLFFTIHLRVAARIPVEVEGEDRDCNSSPDNSRCFSSNLALSALVGFSVLGSCRPSKQTLSCFNFFLTYETPSCCNL